jgi:hypothetical protein
VAGNPYGSRLFEHHAALLTASAIAPVVADARGYVTVDTKAELRRRGFGATQANAPALLIPIYDVRGELAGYQARPDEPRVKNGKPLKYETPLGNRCVLDVPPAVRAHLGDPARPLLITEGARKADAAVSAGLDCVALLGVWNWRGRNDDDGLVALVDWEYVALNGRQVYVVFDSDVMLKPAVHSALGRLKKFLEHRGAIVAVIYLPHGEAGAKVGLDDYLAAGHTTDALLALAAPELRDPDGQATTTEPRPKPEPRTLEDVDEAFRRWMAEPDLGAVRAVLAAVVANRAPGDPVWLLVVAPPSSGKTETLIPLAALPDVIVTGRMTVGALLSGTATKERAADATGGLLRQIGEHGIIVCKDFGAVLAMPRDARAEVLQALRDIFDGRFDRHVGTDGARQLTWSGHCGFIAGTTEAIDSHHAVIAALGDRFVSVRLILPPPEEQAVRAIKGGGDETEMRAELGAVVAGFVENLDTELPPVTDDAHAYTAKLAALTVRCRSVVERDAYGGRDIISVPTAEQPARVAKQLAKLLAALIHLGCDDSTAWDVLSRIALDSIPAGRRRVLEHLATLDGSGAATSAVAVAIGLPTTTAARHLEDLAAHGVVVRHKQGQGKSDLWTLSRCTASRWPRTSPEMLGSVGSPSDACDTHTHPISTREDFSGEALDRLRDRVAL